MKNNKVATVSRNYSLDLLRIVAMLMIVLFHACYGPINYNFLNDFNKIIFSFLLHFGQIGVTLFMLITGYFSYKSTKKHKDKIIYILYSIWFFFLFNILLFVIFKGEYHIDEYFVLPVSSYMFWYASSYVVILLLAPYFNKLINIISQSEHKNLLIILFVVLTVCPTLYSFYNGVVENGWIFTRFFWFVFMYFLGSYISKYQKESNFLNRERKYFILLTCFSLVMMMTFMFIVKIFLSLINPKIQMHLMWSINSPITLLTSFSIFMVFVKTQISNKSRVARILQKISTYTLDIYLSHNLNAYYAIFASEIILLKNYSDSKKLIIFVFILTIVAFIYGLIISIIKKYTFDRIFYKILHKIDDKFKLNLFE